MRLSLRLDSSHDHIARSDSVSCEFTEAGGFIGRGSDCTWVLNCPDRLISRHHAEIVFDDGYFWLVDTSANGVFHNGADVPIGRTQRIVIAHGDSFRLGSLLIHAALDISDVISPLAGEAVEAAPDIEPSQPAPAPQSPSGSPLRLVDTTDAFQPPAARIPDDWEIDLRASAAPREVPALVVNRRLNALQRVASQALLSNLLPHDFDLADTELTPEAAAGIGKSLRICLELAWNLRAEFDRVDGRLTGSKRDEFSDTVIEVDRFARGLLQDEGGALRVADLQQLVAHLRGRHVALHDSFTESLTTIVEQFQPEKFEERLASAHKEGGFGRLLKRLLNRLFPASRLWRFYCSWHEQQRGNGYRAVHQLFEKKLISVYRRLNKARQLEGEALSHTKSEKITANAAQ